MIAIVLNFYLIFGVVVTARTALAAFRKWGHLQVEWDYGDVFEWVVAGLFWPVTILWVFFDNAAIQNAKEAE